MGSAPVQSWAQDTEISPTLDETAAASSTPCRCVGEMSESVANIERVLSEPMHATGFDFTDEPLENIINFLQEEYNIPIQLDVPALEDAGLTSDEPVTANIQHVCVRSGLRLLLKSKHLTYIIQNEVLIITTPEVAEAELTTCVYDVRDLIGENKDGKGIDALIDVIVSCTAVETWAENGGGEAEIRPLRPGLLVIAQSREVHDDIAELLDAIRQILD
jgi:hypothetical protein